jgi:hypothetical protein
MCTKHCDFKSRVQRTLTWRYTRARDQLGWASRSGACCCVSGGDSSTTFSRACLWRGIVKPKALAGYYVKQQRVHTIAITDQVRVRDNQCSVIAGCCWRASLPKCHELTYTRC